jgi:hypothetical protein
MSQTQAVITQSIATMAPPSAKAIQQFWAKLRADTIPRLVDELDLMANQELLYKMDDDFLVGMCDFIWQHVKENSPLIYTKDPTTGVSLTEYVCALDQCADTGDTLDDLIERKVPVTDNCYRLIMGSDLGDEGSADHLGSLIKSGYLPQWEHPLDGCTSGICIESDFEFEAAFGCFTNPDGKFHSKLQVGVTHEEGGRFENLWKEYGGKEPDE